MGNEVPPILATRWRKENENLTGTTEQYVDTQEKGIYRCVCCGNDLFLSGTKFDSKTGMAAPHVAGLLLLGPVKSDGTAIGDPDDDPDPIAHR